jgi:hypothetical protein
MGNEQCEQCAAAARQQGRREHEPNNHAHHPARRCHARSLLH